MSHAAPHNTMLKTEPGLDKAIPKKTIIQEHLEYDTIRQTINYDTSDTCRINPVRVSDQCEPLSQAVIHRTILGIGCNTQFKVSRGPLYASVTSLSILAPTRDHVTHVWSIFYECADSSLGSTTKAPRPFDPWADSLSLVFQQLTLESIPPGMHVTCPSGGANARGASHKRAMKDDRQKNNGKRQQMPDGRKKPNGDGDGGGDDEDEDGDEDEPLTPRVAPPADQHDGPLLLFACPFYKRDPLKHQCCLHYKLSRYNDVRQHIKRVHTYPEKLCLTCYTCWGPQEQTEFDEHIRKNDCRTGAHQHVFRDLTWGEFEANTIWKGDTDATKKKLMRLSHAEKWYWTWDKLFIGIARPGSPHVTGPFSECVEYLIDRLALDLNTLMPSDRREHVTQLLRSYVTPSQPPLPRDTPYSVPYSVPNTAGATGARQGPTASLQSPVRMDRLPQAVPVNASLGRLGLGRNALGSNWSANPGVAYSPTQATNIGAVSSCRRRTALSGADETALLGQPMPRGLAEVEQVTNLSSDGNYSSLDNNNLGLQSNRNAALLNFNNAGQTMLDATQPAGFRQHQHALQAYPNNIQGSTSRAWPALPSQQPIEMLPHNQFDGMLAADLGMHWNAPGLAQGSIPYDYQATNFPAHTPVHRRPTQPSGPFEANFGVDPPGHSRSLFPATANLQTNLLPGSFLDIDDSLPHVGFDDNDDFNTSPDHPESTSQR